MYQEKDKVEERPKKKNIPTDLSSLYMENLSAMSEANTEEQYYRHVLQSINLGRALLPDKYEKLKNKAGELIQSRSTYPSRRQMELTENRYYRLGGKNTGSIIVRPDELEEGIREALNQQCSELTPYLKEIDNEIFLKLTEDGWIKREDSTYTLKKELIKNIRTNNND